MSELGKSRGFVPLYRDLGLGRLRKERRGICGDLTVGERPEGFIIGTNGDGMKTKTNKTIYCDAEDPFITSCCGIPMIGDIVSEETKCPYCEEVITLCKTCGSHETLQDGKCFECKHEG